MDFVKVVGICIAGLLLAAWLVKLGIDYYFTSKQRYLRRMVDDASDNRES